MSLTDEIINKVVEVTLSGRSRIAVCAHYGISCEGWLKVEIISALTPLLANWLDLSIVPEADNVVLTVQTETEQVLLELKTFPTNYGRGGKPITNFVQGVIEDLVKLKSRTGPTVGGLSIWMAYPIPEPIPPTWQGHLNKIKAVSAQTLRTERIPLWESAFANLYVMRCK